MKRRAHWILGGSIALVAITVVILLAARPEDEVLRLLPEARFVSSFLVDPVGSPHDGRGQVYHVARPIAEVRNLLVVRAPQQGWRLNRPEARVFAMKTNAYRGGVNLMLEADPAGGTRVRLLEFIPRSLLDRVARRWETAMSSFSKKPVP